MRRDCSAPPRQGAHICPRNGRGGDAAVLLIVFPAQRDLAEVSVSASRSFENFSRVQDTFGSQALFEAARPFGHPLPAKFLKLDKVVFFLSRL